MQVEIGNNRRVCVLRKAEERFRPECLGLYSSREKNVRASAMFWGCICHDGVGTITDIQGSVDSIKYISI
jgi:hypothetical protein